MGSAGGTVWQEHTTREHMALFEVTEEDAEDSDKGSWKIRCGDPQREKTKYEE